MLKFRTGVPRRRAPRTPPPPKSFANFVRVFRSQTCPPAYAACYLSASFHLLILRKPLKIHAFSVGWRIDGEPDFLERRQDHRLDGLLSRRLSGCRWR